MVKNKKWKQNTTSCGFRGAALLFRWSFGQLTGNLQET